MPRPQPAPAVALTRSRPEGHAFEQAEPSATTPASSSAAGGNAASRTAAEEAEPLVKFSIRVSPAHHRHIKVTAAQTGMTLQDLAVTAIREYLEKLGQPLP